MDIEHCIIHLFNIFSKHEITIFISQGEIDRKSKNKFFQNFQELFILSNYTREFFQMFRKRCIFILHLPYFFVSLQSLVFYFTIS